MDVFDERVVTTELQILRQLIDIAEYFEAVVDYLIVFDIFYIICEKSYAFTLKKC